MVTSVVSGSSRQGLRRYDHYVTLLFKNQSKESAFGPRALAELASRYEVPPRVSLATATIYSHTIHEI